MAHHWPPQAALPVPPPPPPPRGNARFTPTEQQLKNLPCSYSIASASTRASSPAPAAPHSPRMMPRRDTLSHGSFGAMLRDLQQVGAAPATPAGRSRSPGAELFPFYAGGGSRPSSGDFSPRRVPRSISTHYQQFPTTPQMTSRRSPERGSHGYGGQDPVDVEMARFLRHHPLAQRLSVEKAQPGIYNIGGRSVEVQFQAAAVPGAPGSLLVIDGPLKQPLADYVMRSEQNIEYTHQGLEREAIEGIPKSERMTFLVPDLHCRLDAMKVAKAQAQYRKMAADCVQRGNAVPEDLMDKYERSLSQKLGHARRSRRSPPQRQAAPSFRQPPPPAPCGGMMGPVMMPPPDNVYTSPARVRPTSPVPGRDVSPGPPAIDAPAGIFWNPPGTSPARRAHSPLPGGLPLEHSAHAPMAGFHRPLQPTPTQILDFNAAVAAHHGMIPSALPSYQPPIAASLRAHSPLPPGAGLFDIPPMPPQAFMPMQHPAGLFGAFGAPPPYA
eukprot:TRINITY_DN22431_c0_g1_i1.p1 TRINITY_DN22431_c0_g1~~TRINITY_DN22431_c0_g1_i1.p1  ORF type:complete len:497 (+),score=59.07 TRINITY_DN22431_c0_g1_i1:87-1577(+)